VAEMNIELRINIPKKALNPLLRENRQNPIASMKITATNTAPIVMRDRYW